MELARGADGRFVDTGQPQQCPNGHPLGRRQVLVSYLPCSCVPGAAGRRTYACRECGAPIYQSEYDRTQLLPPR